MTTSKNSLSVLSSAFIGMMMILFTGGALLFVIVDELDESGWAVFNLIQSYSSFRQALQTNTGNEFTGEATAWLFGASGIPVVVDLMARAVTRYIPIGGTAKSIIRRINTFQKKYLMPLHTYLSILAFGLGLLHLVLSSCIANPFPELGLILTGILIISGLLIKWKAVPPLFYKAFYKFHASLMVTGVLLAILVAGHAVMDSD